MTCRTLRILVLLIGPLAALPRPAAAQETGEVKWRLEYTSARKEAQEKNLPLVIDFVTKKCYWCRKFEESTFKAAKVAATMNERYIPLKVDAEVDTTLAQALRITSYPTIVWATSDGRILGTIEGFQEA